MKRFYERPKVKAFGPLQALTGALGTSSNEDQSDFPEQFPPDGGSIDVCDNQDPDGVC